MADRTTKSPLLYKEALDKQMTLHPTIWKSGGFRSAVGTEVALHFNPANSKTGDKKYQHLVLSRNPGVTAAQLNTMLKGKGVLEGQGDSFIKGGTSYGVNPIYLAIHAMLETGNGTSELSTGRVSGYNGYYNVYGIGAVDSSPLVGGAQFAKSQRWTSVSAAIIGGAMFVGEEYISKGQDTLYKMRWNPEAPGTHQYATDVAWATNQSSPLAQQIKAYFGSMTFDFDMPVYDGSGTYVPGLIDTGKRIVDEAKTHLGQPYVKGDEGPSSFDCSGFVQYVFKKAANIDLPRTAYEQYTMGSPASSDSLMAGDLLFFKDTYKTGHSPNVSHVGIAIGDGTKFIQASGNQVNISDLSNSYWKSHYFCTRRILDDDETYGTGGAGFDYVSKLGDDTPTGLVGGLPLSQLNAYESEMQDVLDRISQYNITHGVIADLKNGGTMHFEIPDEYAESIPISWEDVPIMGRSVGVKGYESSGPRAISFEIELYAGAGQYAVDNPMKKLYEDVAFLQSLEYPDYGKALILPPPVVLLTIGSTIRLKGVITSCETTYKKPIDDQGRAMRVSVNITVSQVSDNPPDYRDVRYRTVRSY